MATSSDVGGKLEIESGRLHGLPFLKPLYGPGPYVFTGATVLLVNYTCDEAAIRAFLPQDLEPAEGNVVSMAFMLCPACTGIGPHDFAMPVIPVRYGDTTFAWIPYIYTSTDASLACYREVQGWPAVLGSVEIEESGGNVRARVFRDGREVMAATAQMGGETMDSLGDAYLPTLLYKEIPNVDTSGTDVSTYVTSTSGITNVHIQAGTGLVEFPDPGDEPVARLLPETYLGAIFGGFDDHYPASIQTLDGPPGS